MRKTNKKLSKLVDDKSGVILVTIIFIVAMALIFITTALTITIANRQRIYTNAKSDQARLTVTSLSQALWQAIYSQQINDDMLYDLANGSTGNGSLVTFECSDIPGMGTASSGTSATAYFYLIQEENLSADPQVLRKIGIECKCEIDGDTQYYTLVLEKHQSEGQPASWFDVGLNLGDGGEFSSCVMGWDVDYLPSNYITSMPTYSQYVSWRPSGGATDDNIAVLHNPTFSGIDNMGFYANVVTDGTLSFNDATYARDMYFIGRNAGVTYGDSNQNIAAVYNQNGQEVSSHPANPQLGEFHFYGSEHPFTGRNYTSWWPPVYTLAPVTNNTFSWRGVESMHFTRSTDTSYTQFNGGIGTLTGQFFDNGNGIQSVYIDDGITYTNGSSYDRIRRPSDASWQADDAASYVSYLTPDSGKTDTIDELIGTDGVFAGKCPSEADTDALSTYNSVGNALTGIHLFSGEQEIPAGETVYVDVSHGDVIVFMDENSNITFGSNSYIQVSGGGDGRFIILLKSGARVIITDYSGIYETNCFNSYSDFSDVSLANLDQSVAPKTFIFALYTGASGANAPVIFAQNGNRVLTANLGFYPQTNPNGSGGCHFAYYDCGGDDVYYGRISAGGMDKMNGNFFYMPYCPSPPGTAPDRDTAYRDNTDYSVVQAESGYFTV